jgi:hypothetical protein
MGGHPPDSRQQLARVFSLQSQLHEGVTKLIPPIPEASRSEFSQVFSALHGWTGKTPPSGAQQRLREPHHRKRGIGATEAHKAIREAQRGRFRHTPKKLACRNSETTLGTDVGFSGFGATPMDSGQKFSAGVSRQP